MIEVIEKGNLLKDAGYFYNFNREIYFNRQEKKVFSESAIGDNSIIWLRQKINEKNYTGTWLFFFKDTPMIEIQQEIMKELG
jgi:hypothetical protein